MTIEVPSAGELTLLENPVRKRDYLVEIEALEFTSLCPMTGQPDYAAIIISYIPDKLIFELKSLKLYLQTFRNKLLTHEEAINEIFDKIEESVKPKKISVKGQFSVRGGIKTTVIAESPDSRRNL
ncbi:NADPH-dependent 7-cyano-7-deazaguanine reductase QueF [candidate division WOR-3 bacterium]|nr:NADPH-dependent 7-cyano-7-deazaguanine reductase QueF [candidate division WOR-3 bacterium]